MRFKKSKIAFSACCGVLCLLLVGLWVRSYWWRDVIRYSYAKERGVAYDSGNGSLGLSKYDYRGWGGMAPSPGITAFSGELLPFSRPNFTIEKTDLPVTTLWLPFWCPLVILISFASASWFPWSTRFSLKTALLLITSLSLVLGLIIYLGKK